VQHILAVMVQVGILGDNLNQASDYVNDPLSSGLTDGIMTACALGAC
jgi:hypothetical protein